MTELTGANSKYRERDGFTLLEMMVVIALVGLILGMGTAFIQFSKSEYALQANINQVLSTLQRARNQAMTQNGPAYVRVQKKTGDVQLLSEQTMGRWEFEEIDDGKIPGALNRSLQVPTEASNSPLVKLVPGRLGQAISFTTDKPCKTEAIPFMSPDQGLVLRVWLWVEKRSSRRVLISQGSEFTLGIKGSGTLVSSVENLVAESDTRIPLKQWLFIRVLFYRNSLFLFLNGNQVASAIQQDDSEEIKLENKADVLVIGPRGNSGSRLLMDSLQISALIPRTLHTLPSQVKVKEEAFIKFNPDGTSRGGKIQLFVPYREEGKQLQVLRSGIVKRSTWKREIKSNKEDEEENKTETDQEEGEDGGNNSNTNPKE